MGAFTRRCVPLGWILLLTTSVFASDQTKLLAPGSTAPPIAMKQWLKGQPVKAFAKKGTYVVEFWATWCLPCIESMPHLSKLAKANPDVTFIGVGVWENWDAEKLPQFVAKMGDKMAYRVGYSGNKDGMAATWLKPALQDSIPQAFVVKDGLIVWVGHPLQLEQPLAQIKSGTFNVQEARIRRKADLAKTQRRRDISDALAKAQSLRSQGKRKEAAQTLDATESKFPESARSVEGFRFAWLAEDDLTAWEARAKELAATKEPQKLAVVNWFARDNAESPQRTHLARKALSISLEATEWKEPNTLTFATTIYRILKEDVLELKATIALLDAWPQTGWEDAENFREELKKRKVELEQKLKNG